MNSLEWENLGYARIEAIIRRDRIAHDLECTRCGDPEETRFWLAILGWSAAAFIHEAYPELYGAGRG